MLSLTHCLLTGGRCVHLPISTDLNSFFVSEPYDEKRQQRELAIKKALEGFNYIISDHKIMNIALTCKICRQIQSSEFGIVDISGCNPNVLIELGMLYGFSKPTIILLKKSEHPEFDVPSNIKGIEQIRYTDFDEITEKIKKAVNTFFELRTKTDEYIIDMRPMLQHLILELELEIETRELVETGLKSQIIDFKTLGNVGVVILDKGTRNGVKTGMTFEVYRSDKIAMGNYLEENVGLIIVTFAQEKIAQCQPLYIDPDLQFWKDVSSNTFAKNIVKPHPSKTYKDISIEQVETILSKAKILHEYMYSGRVS